MEKLLQLILERLEQIQQYLFSRRSGSQSVPVNVQLPDRIRVQEPLRVISDTGSYITGDVSITNTPLPVSQSGSWNVGISNQPIGVNVQNTPLNVNVQNTPLNVNIQNTPVSVSQSGTWNVSISNQPIQTRYADVLYASISATASGDTQIIAGVSGKRIRVIAYAVVASGSVNIKFRSGTTDITGSMRVVEGGGIAHAYDQGLFQTNVGQALQINLSANATVGGYVVYREI